MSITHEEAQHWIHLHSDQSLDAGRQRLLNTHLTNCSQCNNYANEFSATERALVSTLQKHWQARPLPHTSTVVLEKIKIKKWDAHTFLPTRIAILASTFLLFGFTLWQFMLSSPASNHPTPATVTQIPTPATAFLTGTQNTTAGQCDYIQYTIAQDETLAEIARQFSVDISALMQWNNLTSETVISGQSIKILACHQTPTGTSYSPTYTLTPEQKVTGTTPG